MDEVGILHNAQEFFSRDVCDQLRSHERDLSFLFQRLLDRFRTDRKLIQ